MNLVLLCFCSIVVARYFEKRMKVASIAHSILFIIMAFFFLFDSGFSLIDEAMINIFGKNNFILIHDALVQASPIYQGTISVLLIMEIVVYATLSFIAIIALIKGIKKAIAKTKFTYNYVLPVQTEAINIPTGEDLRSYQNTYLVLSHLRN